MSVHDIRTKRKAQKKPKEEKEEKVLDLQQEQLLPIKALISLMHLAQAGMFIIVLGKQAYILSTQQSKTYSIGSSLDLLIEQGLLTPPVYQDSIGTCQLTDAGRECIKQFQASRNRFTQLEFFDQGEIPERKGSKKHGS